MPVKYASAFKILYLVKTASACFLKYKTLDNYTDLQLSSRDTCDT